MYPHGILFHHFHDAIHPAGQGSLSADQFASLLEDVGIEKFLCAVEWREKALNGTLADDDLCITFDDNLRCQYDIALPVLKTLGLTAFWFVYTSPLEGNIEPLELYRYFRTVQFATAEEFYDAFYAQIEAVGFTEKVNQALQDSETSRYLQDKPFYSEADRKFRYVRNKILTNGEYDRLMYDMIRDAGMDISTVAGQLWMDAESLRSLARDEHVVGLHSHSHSVGLSSLGGARQLIEYEQNISVLHECLGTVPDTVSYPFGEYDSGTLSLMENLGVTLGFRADMSGPAASLLEFPRENHATTMARMPR